MTVGTCGGAGMADQSKIAKQATAAQIRRQGLVCLAVRRRVIGLLSATLLSGF